VSYGPQPGYPQPQYGPQYGPPQGYPGYGPPGHYGRPGNALAYVCAGLFLVCGGLALLTAIAGWNDFDSADLLVAMVGVAFTDEITGNIDFAVSASMTVGCSTLTFAVLLFTRLDLFRWLLAFIGALVTVYYGYAIIKLLADGGGEFIAIVLVSFLVWTAATVLVLLPATGRAMRGYQRKLAQYPAQYPPQYPQQTGYPY
jgi:hypothetical protein